MKLKIIIPVVTTRTTHRCVSKQTKQVRPLFSVQLHFIGISLEIFSFARAHVFNVIHAQFLWSNIRLFQGKMFLWKISDNLLRASKLMKQLTLMLRDSTKFIEFNSNVWCHLIETAKQLKLRAVWISFFPRCVHVHEWRHYVEWVNWTWSLCDTKMEHTCGQFNAR